MRQMRQYINIGRFESGYTIKYGFKLTVYLRMQTIT